MQTDSILNEWEEFKQDIAALDSSRIEIDEDLEYSNSLLTPLFYHEALDRTALAEKFVSDMLYKHPVYHQNKDLNSKLDKVLELLTDMYQDIPNLPNYV